MYDVSNCFETFIFILCMNSIDELLRDTDSDMDEEDDQKKIKKSKKKKHGKDAWLMETGDDEIVDFMDPSAAKQVIGEHDLT